MFKLPLKIDYNRESFIDKIKDFFIYLFFYIMVLFVTGVFLRICDLLIYNKFSFSFLETFKEVQTRGVKNVSFLFIVLFGPFMEELMFRLPLVLKRINIQISLCIFSLYFVGDKITSINFYSFLTWIKIIPIFLIIFFGKYFIQEKYLLLIKVKYFRMYFAFLSIFFGIVHLTNFYDFIPNQILVFSFLFIIPHIILGGFLSILRLKYGFFIGLAFHSLYNLIIILGIGV